MFNVPQDCETNPCHVGESCSFRTHSTFCDRCASNEIGPDGVACTACSGGTEPDAAQNTCVPCPPGKESKIGLCTTCPSGKIGVNGICRICPANEEPASGAIRCQCQAGFYNSSYGAVQCPEAAAQQVGLQCQPCAGCLECKIDEGGHVAVVKPGFALGPAAAASYQGIEAGPLWVDKVLHKCTRGMCEGESTGFMVHLAMTIARESMPDAAGDTNYDAIFDLKFRNAMASSLKVGLNDITVEAMTSAAEPGGGLRRWLQTKTQVWAWQPPRRVAFAIAVASDQKGPLIANVEELRDTSSATITLADGYGTALLSTLTKHTVSTSVLPGVQCRTGHDPASPLCHVCSEGFVEGMDKMCFECDGEDASLSSEVRTFLLCLAIILALLVAMVAHRLYRAHAERGEIKDAGEMRWVKPSFTAGGSAPLGIYAKICVSHYQILTQFRK
jgi:hypothetical protein